MIKENIKEGKNRNMLPTNLDGTKKKKKLTDSQKKEERTAWMILSPMFLWWIAACGFPLVFGFALAKNVVRYYFFAVKIEFVW